MFLRFWRALRVVLLVLVTGAAGLLAMPAAAAPLSSLKQTRLPPLPAPPVGLAALGDGLLAITRDSAWWWTPDATGWQPADWKPAAPVHAVLGRPGETYLVMDAAKGGRSGGLRVARLDRSAGRLALQAELPPLPQDLHTLHGTTLAGALVLTGLGADARPQLWRLDPADAAPAWRRLPDWPGAMPGQGASTLVAQTGALFITLPPAADGVAGAPAGDAVWRWQPASGWQPRGNAPGRVLPGSGRATGQAHLLYALQPATAAQAAPAPTAAQATPAPAAAQAAPAPDAAQAALAPAASPVAAAPQLKTLHTVTNAWGALPESALAGATLFAPWRNGLVFAVGAGSVGNADGASPHSTPMASIELETGKLLLKWLDWLVIVVYLASMLGIGGYFYLREKRNSTSDFFVGGRSIPFWAAGVSLYAANTSSISYIAIPAKAFETNWQYLTNNLVAVLGLMFVAVWIVPLLRRLDLMSVFSYLETRFHPAIRMLSSALCILVQLGSRMSVILFLPSLAIATITGIDVVWSVLMMGGFTIVYTAMGGMKAVVWTDVVQLVVKMGGALFAIGFMVRALPGGVGQLIDTAAAEHKTRLFDFSFDLTQATVWGFIFLVLFDVVLTFPKDQVLMQRTLSTKSDKDAGRSIWAFAAIMIPGGFVFYSIGTALFVYYKTHPERMNPLLTIDATFPLFIAAELPMGITGLIIAGIFAAAMATLSSIMNSVSTLASVDFYEKLVKRPDPRKSVLFAELMTVVSGLIGIGFALILSRYDIHSLFDVSIELAGLLGGGFAGAYTLGMFTRRANSPGVAIGIGCSIVLTTIAWSMKLVHPYFYLAVSILLCIVIGYAASLFFPAPQRSLKGLTIYADAD